MPLIILNKSFNEELNPQNISHIMRALYMLPEPEVIPMEEANVSANEAVICLQREMLYIDSASPKKGLEEKKYAGTKLLNTCVLLYLYSNSDHLLVHIDHLKPDLNESLQRFKNKDDLKAILVGGNPYDHSSQHTIQNSLNALLELCKKSGVTITLVSQKLLERNITIDSDKYGMCYSLLIEKANLLTQQFFDTNLDVDRFPPQQSIAGFKEIKFDKPGCNIQLANIILTLNPTHGNTHEHHEIKMRIDGWIRKFIHNIDIFYQCLDGLFSPKGFETLHRICTWLSLYPQIRLSEPAFDLITKKIVIMPAHIYCANESARVLRCLLGLEADKKSYVYCISDAGQNYQPKLGVDFIEALNKHIPEAANGKLTEDELLMKLGHSDRDDLLLIFHRANREINKTPTTFTFFHPRNISDIGYREGHTTSFGLQTLNHLTEKEFVLKIRSLSGIADAILTCSNNDEVLSIQACLDAYKIDHINIGEKTICVPAINLDLVRNQIQAAKNEWCISIKREVKRP